ncbi:MAG: hypothetical protein J6U00_06875 [Ruminococcus sp.]|uniref:hypothetical protein n=1 Tax=Ruminococcus sp. TaxID=41978 RepID=UPI001B23C9FA|nr:hypothetical protein [Ruminococcus sp.]MBO7473711.1 hypothetical protein [Ruminococcus sp.]
MRLLKIIAEAVLLTTLAVLTAGCSDNNVPVNEMVQTAYTTVTATVTSASVTTETATVHTEVATSDVTSTEAYHLLRSPEDIFIHCTDEEAQKYEFVYDSMVFSALYEPDNWHIKDSYLIDDYDDIVIICQALTAVHKVHSADMQSYRTAEDMANEWYQHNIAYSLLPEGSSWKNSARDVDLDANDQNKNLFDFVLDKLDINVTKQEQY